MEFVKPNLKEEAKANKRNLYRISCSPSKESAALPPCPVLFHSRHLLFYKLQSCIDRHAPGFGWDTKVSQFYPHPIDVPKFLSVAIEVPIFSQLQLVARHGEKSWGVCFIGFQQIAFSITMGFC